MPKVSIVMPSYNHEKYVAEAIQSVLDQTFQDFEIVITDDGSLDKTVEEIKKFKDPRIKLFCFEKNQGASVAANNCVRNATGKYIAILSSDDVFLPDKLEKQVNFLDKNDEVGAVFGQAQIIDQDGKTLDDNENYYCQVFRQENKSRHGWLNHFFYVGNCLCHPSAMVRKQCYDKVGLYDERLEQLPDFDLWIRLCLFYEINIMTDKLIKFRYLSGGGNTSSGDNPSKRIRSRIENSFVLKNYLKIKNGDDFLKIFPQDFDFPVEKNETDSDLLSFYLSYLCVKTGNSAHEFFGYGHLFELLGNQHVAKKILDFTGFSYKDFIKLTGQYDVFSCEEITEKEKRKKNCEK
jgi:glycosyltransferase involved in cell wall biosynthesis